MENGREWKGIENNEWDERTGGNKKRKMSQNQDFFNTDSYDIM